MLRPVDLALDAPDAPDALRRAERLVEAAAQSSLDLTGLGEPARRVATVACQLVPYLAVLLVRDPGRWVRVANDPYLDREKPREVLVDQVARAVAAVRSAAELRAALREVRADELVRLGYRELTLGQGSEVGRELARLADACFDAAIAFHDAELRARHGTPLYSDDDGSEKIATLAVIAMGKLGGEELDFASDVDVIYVYGSDRGAAGALSLHEYFAKLCTAVTSAISEVTEGDTVFRVDLRLRPEGSTGAIANSVAQLERITRRSARPFGRPWARQAWIKARACAGDTALGDQVIAMLRPFVFPRIAAPTVIDDMRELNRRIKRDLVRPTSSGFDLKNGVGGIREIEFFVQALQLIHAGKRPQLRCRGTLAALDALLFAGLIHDDEHRALSGAYRWLRHAKHVLQLEAGLQTQTVPTDEAARLRFARRLGYPTDEAFAAELAVHTAAVSQLFATLGEPTDEHPGVIAILRGELSEDVEAAALSRLGFVDVTMARAELSRARRNAGSPLSPAATERTARVGEARLVELGDTPPTRTIAQVADDLAARLATVDLRDPEAPWSAIAEVKAGHVLRVGLADFAGALDPLAVCAELTVIAEACLAQALTIIEAQLVATHGPPPADAKLAVLGLGKLGGRELGYAADLDVVFVFSAHDDEAIAWFSRCAQRLLGALRQRTPRGRLYELDTRLRPSGTAGLLVTSLAGWRRYHAEQARLWERQALLKLRPVAGDRVLGEEVARLVAETVYGAPVADPAAVAREIRTMRDRVERELGGPNDLKTGAGGIMDVEFAAQYLQLVHGHAQPALRTTSTQSALRAAATCGIAPTREIELLDQGYPFLRKIEHRMRVVHDQPIHRLPDTRDELDKLARRSGFLDGGVLLEHVARWQHAIRAAYLSLLGA